MYVTFPFFIHSEPLFYLFITHLSYAVYAFSAGQRACIGQHFSRAESVCILANLVQRYEVLLPTPANAKVQKMTEGEKMDWMLEWVQHITMFPVRDRVRLRRRKV